jgi:hypothetical protein
MSAVFEPKHDRSILLAKNLNPRTSKVTLQIFVKATQCVDVFNVVSGKDGKAIVILSETGRCMLLIFCSSNVFFSLLI